MSGQQAPRPWSSAGKGGGGSGGGGWRAQLTPNRVLALVLAALAVVLIAENTRQVKIRLVVPVVTMPLYAALLIMLVIGALCGLLLARGRTRGRSRGRTRG